METSNLLNNEWTDTNSSYLAYRDGKLILLFDQLILLFEEKSAPALAQFVHNQLRALILDPQFTNVGARSALKQGRYRFGLYPELGSPEAAAELHKGLLAFVVEQLTLGKDFTTFIASFVGPTLRDEKHFELLLWQQLQGEYNAGTYSWDSTASSNPEDLRFSFSFAGRAFFIVGLHSGSASWNRRFAWPTLIFNFRHQVKDFPAENAVTLH